MSAIVWMKHKVLCAQTCIYSKVNIERYIRSLESIAFLFLRGGGGGGVEGERMWDGHAAYTILHMPYMVPLPHIYHYQ